MAKQTASWKPNAANQRHETSAPERKPERKEKALLGTMVPRQAFKELGLLAKVQHRTTDELLREPTYEYFLGNGPAAHRMSAI
jgi:hypothetical protein